MKVRLFSRVASATNVCLLLGAQIMKEKQRFERVVVSREEALAMFQENKFKVEIISGLAQVRAGCAASVSCGPDCVRAHVCCESVILPILA